MPTTDGPRATLHPPAWQRILAASEPLDVDAPFLLRKLPDGRFDDSAWPTPSGVEEEHLVLRLPLGAAEQLCTSDQPDCKDQCHKERVTVGPKFVHQFLPIPSVAILQRQ